MAVTYVKPGEPLAPAELGPHTFEADLLEGRASVRMPGGARVDIEKMMMIVVITGDDQPRVLMHPRFEQNAAEFMRRLSSDLLEWAQRVDARTTEGESNTHEIPRPKG